MEVQQVFGQSGRPDETTCPVSALDDFCVARRSPALNSSETGRLFSRTNVNDPDNRDVKPGACGHAVVPAAGLPAPDPCVRRPLPGLIPDMENPFSVGYFRTQRHDKHPECLQ
jgi:hypothetical protein